MNNSLFRVMAVIAGAIAFLATLPLTKLMLDVLHSAFPADTALESGSWRTAVTVTGAVIFFILYALLGIVFGYTRPEEKWKWGLWLAISPILLAVSMLIFMGIEYPMTLILGVLAGIIGGSLGAQIGASFKKSPSVAADA